MTIQKIQAAGVIIFTNDTHQIRYLLLLSAKGHWDFAKGRLDPDETIEQAAVREVYEETGISIEYLDATFKESVSYTLSHDAKPYLKTVTYFISKTDNTTITLSDEHDGFIWCSFEKALSLLSHKESQEILTKANRYIMNHLT